MPPQRLDEKSPVGKGKANIERTLASAAYDSRITLYALRFTHHASRITHHVLHSISQTLPLSCGHEERARSRVKRSAFPGGHQFEPGQQRPGSGAGGVGRPDSATGQTAGGARGLAARAPRARTTAQHGDRGRHCAAPRAQCFGGIGGPFDHRLRTAPERSSVWGAGRHSGAAVLSGDCADSDPAPGDSSAAQPAAAGTEAAAKPLDGGPPGKSRGPDPGSRGEALVTRESWTVNSESISKRNRLVAAGAERGIHSASPCGEAGRTNCPTRSKRELKRNNFRV